MNTDTEKLSPQQSLDLISQMINQAKGNFIDNSFYFIFWGWVLVIINLSVYILIQVNYSQPYAIWLLVIPATLVSLLKGYKQSKAMRIKTHLDEIITVLWLCNLIFALIVSFFLGKFINHQTNGIILMVSGICTIVTGSIIRFKPLTLGGIALSLGGIACLLVDQEIRPIIAAVSILLGYIIPGYLLKAKHQYV